MCLAVYLKKHKKLPAYSISLSTFPIAMVSPVKTTEKEGDSISLYTHCDVVTDIVSASIEKLGRVNIICLYTHCHVVTCRH